MYETEINNVLTAMLADLPNATSNGEIRPPTHARSKGAKAFLVEAMKVLVSDLSARLDFLGVGGSMGLLVRSNFLKRAAYDLYGPCMSAAILYERGEWSVVSSVRTVRQRGFLATVGSLGRSFITNVLWKLPDTIAERVDAQIKMLCDAHVAFGAEVVSRLQLDATLLRDLFGVTGGATQLYVAGSDPHRCAQRVVIATFANGKVVYKPTDLTFQLLLMGSPESFRHCQGGLARVGESLFTATRAGLPVLHVAAMPHRKGDYGYMEFKAHKDVQTRQEVESHFEKLGGLLAVSAVLGLTDLHQQNVMATADGPFAIDAEMGFSFPRAGTSFLAHTCLNDALAPRRIHASIIGGTFAPFYDARRNAWDANNISEPYGADEINAAVRLTRDGPLCDPRCYVDLIDRGASAAIDQMGTRLNHIYNWTLAYDRVSPSPLARVILDTTAMATNYAVGVTAYLTGTLVDEQTAINGTFSEWMTWYAGRFNALPAALYCPRSPQVLYDPRGQIGATMIAATGGGVSVAGTHALRMRLGTMLMGAAVAKTKRELRLDLETTMKVRVTGSPFLRGLAARN